MNDEQKAAQSAYDAATRKLQGCKPNDKDAESAFAIAYKRMVDVGLVSMPIKRKYRD